MKLLKKGLKSAAGIKPKNAARVKDGRTKSVLTFHYGLNQENNAGRSAEQDLWLAVEFGQAILESALLMSERLLRLENSSSTLQLRDQLANAKTRFGVLKARASAYPLTWGPYEAKNAD